MGNGPEGASRTGAERASGTDTERATRGGWRRALRSLATFAAIALALAILGGHAGRLHPALDSLGQLRLQLIGLAALGCLVLAVLRMGTVFVMLGAVAVGSAALTAPWLVPREGVPGRAFTVMQQNLLYKNSNRAALLKRIREVDPDVIALQEIGGAARGMIASLGSDFPFKHQCRGVSAVGDVAILSRTPFALDLRQRCTPGLAIAAVRLGDASVAIGSLHLHWPWPFGQDRHVESLARHVPAIGAPGLLVGDFNSVPWSASMHRIAAMMNGRIARGIGPTRVSLNMPRWLRSAWDIPIDHAITTRFVEVLDVEAIALDGSDHDTVVTRFRLRLPPAPPREDVIEIGL